MKPNRLFHRRHFLAQSSFLTAAMVTPGVFAEELMRTPAQTAGPFYPDRLPLDTDNDLLIVNDQIKPSVGEITHLTGRILDPKGNPIRNAVVEIWQVDNQGAYLHSRGESGRGRDSNFQGFGRFLTSSTGEYYFRTIKPVPYPGRTPHIHFAVKQNSGKPFTTQCYVKGNAKNENDGVLRRINDPAARQSVIVDFAPLADSKLGELAAKFDIVLGRTPEA